LRLRKMYLRDPKSTNFEGLNEAEFKELLKRKDLKEWVQNEEELFTEILKSTFKLSLYERVMHANFVKETVKKNIEVDPELRHMQDYETYFMDMIISTQPVKQKTVEGTYQLGLREIIELQDEQRREMNELEFKFEQNQ
jgi:hypothetical protein